MTVGQRRRDDHLQPSFLRKSPKKKDWWLKGIFKDDLASPKPVNLFADGGEFLTGVTCLQVRLMWGAALHTSIDAAATKQCQIHAGRLLEKLFPKQSTTTATKSSPFSFHEFNRSFETSHKSICTYVSCIGAGRSSVVTQIATPVVPLTTLRMTPLST